MTQSSRQRSGSYSHLNHSSSNNTNYDHGTPYNSSNHQNIDVTSNRQHHTYEPSEFPNRPASTDPPPSNNTSLPHHGYQDQHSANQYSQQYHPQMIWTNPTPQPTEGRMGMQAVPNVVTNQYTGNNQGGYGTNTQG